MQSAPASPLGAGTQTPPASRANWWLITPMIFTLLPLVRHVFKGSRHRDTIFVSLVGAGLLHGAFTMLGGASASTLEEPTFSPGQLAARQKDR